MIVHKKNYRDYYFIYSWFFWYDDKLSTISFSKSNPPPHGCTFFIVKHFFKGFQCLMQCLKSQVQYLLFDTTPEFRQISVKLIFFLLFNQFCFIISRCHGLNLVHTAPSTDPGVIFMNRSINFIYIYLFIFLYISIYLSTLIYQ